MTPAETAIRSKFAQIKAATHRLDLIGEINATTERQLRMTLNRARGARVLISFNSDGGDGGVSKRLASALFAYPGETHGLIRAGARAHSAAALIWSCTSVRQIDAGATVLYHRCGGTAGFFPITDRYLASDFQRQAMVMAEFDDWQMALVRHVTGLSKDTVVELFNQGDDGLTLNASRCAALGLTKPIERITPGRHGFTPAESARIAALAPTGSSACLGITPFALLARIP